MKNQKIELDAYFFSCQYENNPVNPKDQMGEQTITPLHHQVACRPIPVEQTGAIISPREQVTSRFRVEGVGSKVQDIKAGDIAILAGAWNKAITGTLVLVEDKDILGIEDEDEQTERTVQG